MKNLEKNNTEKSEKETEKLIKKVSLNLYQITKKIEKLNSDDIKQNDLKNIADFIKKCDKDLLQFFNVKFTKKSKDNLLDFFN